MKLLKQNIESVTIDYCFTLLTICRLEQAKRKEAENNKKLTGEGKPTQGSRDRLDEKTGSRQTILGLGKIKSLVHNTSTTSFNDLSRGPSRHVTIKFSNGLSDDNSMCSPTPRTKLNRESTFSKEIRGFHVDTSLNVLNRTSKDSLFSNAMQSSTSPSSKSKDSPINRRKLLLEPLKTERQSQKSLIKVIENDTPLTARANRIPKNVPPLDSALKKEVNSSASKIKLMDTSPAISSSMKKSIATIEKIVSPYAISQRPRNNAKSKFVRHKLSNVNDFSVSAETNRSSNRNALSNVETQAVSSMSNPSELPTSRNNVSNSGNVRAEGLENISELISPIKSSNNKNGRLANPTEQLYYEK